MSVLKNISGNLPLKDYTKEEWQAILDASNRALKVSQTVEKTYDSPFTWEHQPMRLGTERLGTDHIFGRSLRDMIAMRMHWQEGVETPFTFLEAVRLDNDRIVVFVISNGKPVTIETNSDLFPSDELITQLRLIA